MGKFIIKRVLISIVVVFLVSVFAFSLMHILPGDPARLSLGEEASQEDVDALREELNLNKPVLEQYFIWISGIFRGDFGQSIQFHRPVLDIMQERLPRSVAIGLPTLVISTIIGIAFGIICAIRRGKFIDQVITFLATIGMGTPVFWIGILGIYLFAMRLGILPIQGFTSPTEDFAKYVHQAILPVFCLSTHQVASVSRQTRTNMLDVINQDYIRTAKANGIRPSSIVFKHALRNALIPIVTVIAMQVRMVIGGSLIVEQVFNIAGIGQLLQTAVGNRDYLIVQGAVLVISLVTVGCNLLVDILYGVVDPRIRKTQR